MLLLLSKGGEAGEVPERAMERTTSFLQIGHVRRRVVSHGDLFERGGKKGFPSVRLFLAA